MVPIVCKQSYTRILTGSTLNTGCTCQNLQCPIHTVLKKKKLSAPKLAKIFFPINVSQIYFAPLYYGRSFALGMKENGLLTLGGNSGPVPGRKVSLLSTVHSRWSHTRPILYTR